MALFRFTVGYLKSAGMLVFGLALLAICISNLCTWWEVGQLPIHTKFGNTLVSWQSDPVMFAWNAAMNAFLLYWGALIVTGVVLRKY